MVMKAMMRASLCAALIAVTLAGCGNRPVQEQPDPTEPQQIESVEATDAVDELVIPDHVVVSTPYGNMRYSDQWAEFMKTEQQMDGDVLQVFFAAVINEVEYGLFTVTIGGSEGEPVCMMTDPAGVQRNVYVSVEEMVSISALTDDECNRLYAMQEEINYIIENIE